MEEINHKSLAEEIQLIDLSDSSRNLFGNNEESTTQDDDYSFGISKTQMQ